MAYPVLANLIAQYESDVGTFTDTGGTTPATTTGDLVRCWRPGSLTGGNTCGDATRALGTLALHSGDFGSFPGIRATGISSDGISTVSKPSLTGDFHALMAFIVLGNGGANARFVDCAYSTGFFLGSNSSANTMGGGIVGSSILFATASDAAPHLLYASRVGTTMTFAIDGTASVQTGACVSTATSTTVLNFFMAATNDHQCIGSIACFYLHNGTLTAPQINDSQYFVGNKYGISLTGITPPVAGTVLSRRRGGGRPGARGIVVRSSSF